MYHSIDICSCIAEKLRDPSIVLEIFQNNLNRATEAFWDETSFAWGASGVASFYAMMHQNFPEASWDRVAHEYIQLIGKQLQSSSFQNISLFSGLAGCCMTVYLSSENGGRYKSLLGNLDQILITEVEEFLQPLNHPSNLQNPIFPSMYDLANGLSGVLVYLIQRYDNMRLAHLTRYCLEYLVKTFSTPKMVEGRKVLPWCVPKYLILSVGNNGFEDGSQEIYRIDVPFGISGVLGVLALAMKKGIDVPGQKELIQTLSYWIREQQIPIENFVTWKQTIPINGPDPMPTVVPNIWLSGAPGVARCLYLASEALHDPELAEFSEKALLSSLEKASEFTQPIDTSFCLGQAGLLTIAYQMGCDTRKPSFFRLAKIFEDNIKPLYSPSHLFGFRSLVMEESGKTSWIDNPDLFSGASGVAMALLGAQGRSNFPWSYAFAI